MEGILFRSFRNQNHPPPPQKKKQKQKQKQKQKKKTIIVYPEIGINAIVPNERALK